MAVALSKFTLDGGVLLFLAAFDMHVTVVSLEVGLGLEKFDFWAFQKIIEKTHLTYTCMILFLKPKNHIFPIKMQVLMVPLPRLDQKLPKQLNPPSKVYIESARDIFPKKIFSKFFTKFGNFF